MSLCRGGFKCMGEGCACFSLARGLYVDVFVGCLSARVFFVGVGVFCFFVCLFFLCFFFVYMIGPY